MRPPENVLVTKDYLTKGLLYELHQIETSEELSDEFQRGAAFAFNRALMRLYYLGSESEPMYPTGVWENLTDK
jgi:hypothetical protein